MYTDITYILCISALFIMGAYAFLANPKSNTNRSFALMTFFTALWIISIYLVYVTENSPTLPSFFVRLANGTTLYALLFVSYFLYYFPKKTKPIKGIIKYIYPIAISILFLISVFTPYFQDSIQIENGEVVSEVYGSYYPIFVVTLISLVFSLGVFSYRKIKILHGIEKTKLKIVSYSFLLVAIFAILTNVILPQFKILFLIKESILFTLGFIAATLYAIQKHRFFNTTFFAMNILRWLILLIALIAIVLIFTQLFSILLPNANKYYLIILISTLSTILFVKTMDYFPKFIPKDLRELKNSIKELNLNLYYSDSFSKLIHYLENTFITQLNIQNIEIHIVRKHKDNIDAPIYEKDEFTKIISKFKNNLISFPEIDYLKLLKKDKEILKKTLKNFKADLCMPLFAEYRLIGFLILGTKSKKTHYAKEEVQEILKIRNVLEITLMNLLLKHNLQEENDLMKELIEKKTKKLRDQFNEIKSLLKQQSDFIAVTAHEFRTPLSIALFQLEDTLDSHQHKPEVIRDMEIMSQSLNNLKDLTQKMFDVQQFDLNKVVLNETKIDIIDYLKKLMNELKILLEEKDFKFTFNCNIKHPIIIGIDSAQIRQVIINLINNSIKFAPKKNPHVEMGLKDNKKTVQIYISDNGEGVPDKDKKRIFKKFQTTNVNKGTGIGLGLYICKKIIELHKGKIWVENSEEKGAKFIFELPK